MRRRQFIHASAAASLATGFSTSILAALESMGQVKGDVEAVTGNGAKISLLASELQELKDSLRGRLLMPGNDGYDQARRVLNASIDRYPALVVQPSGAADIMSAVSFAEAHSLLLAVKCGGHSPSGKSTCQGGMQLDLSSFRGARVDLPAGTCHVAGGSHLRDLDHESMAHGLVTTSGTVSHTGVGGLTTGGGFGRLARRYGLALDNVKSVNVVTANGELVHASAQQNADLYWAVRGGGGNFGVVTDFEFQLHQMSRKVISGNLMFPLSELRNVLNFYADYSASCPDELYMDFVGRSQPGSNDGVIIINVCYSGPVDQAEAALAPIRKAGKYFKDTISSIDYTAAQQSADNDEPRVIGQYLKGGFVENIPEGLINEMVAGFKPEYGLFLLFQHSGGAINRVAVDATAFPHRYAQANLICAVSWPLTESRDPYMAHLREYWSNMEKYTYGWYTNGVGDEKPAMVNKNYQGNYERLLQIKNQYDPGNLFRLNANVRPTVS
jgi:FAD/FMN-containing dehydrogenase